MIRTSPASMICIHAIALSFATTPVVADLVVWDDFESPDVDAAASIGATNGTLSDNGYWIGATQGFGATRRGIADESAGAFVDPGGEQGFAFRYTNSGLTTAEGVIGNLSAGFFYEVTFDVVADSDTVFNGSPPGTAYSAYLAAFDPGATSRNDVRNSTLQRTVLAATNGNATIDGLYSTISFSYTSDGIADAALLGRDVALVLRGATSSAVIDNVSITVVPEPSAVAMLLWVGVASLLFCLRHHLAILRRVSSF